jgi:hypothetical protein
LQVHARKPLFWIENLAPGRDAKKSMDIRSGPLLISEGSRGSSQSIMILPSPVNEARRVIIFFDLLYGTFSSIPEIVFDELQSAPLPFYIFSGDLFSREVSRKFLHEVLCIREKRSLSSIYIGEACNPVTCDSFKVIRLTCVPSSRVGSIGLAG